MIDSAHTNENEAQAEALFIRVWEEVPAWEGLFCPHGSQVADSCVLPIECRCLVIDCFDM